MTQPTNELTRRSIGRPRSQRRRGQLHIGSGLIVVALLIVGCSSVPSSSSGTSATSPSPAAVGSSAHKQIDQSALQAMLDKTAKEFLIPGAVILLRTPQGEFTITYGTTLLGATTPPAPTPISEPPPIPRR